MSVQRLFIEAPALCGAMHAKKHSILAELAWNAEKGKHHFQREDGETAHDRISFLFDWQCADEGKRNYCRNLAHLAVLAHYKNEHGEKEHDDHIHVLAKTLAEIEPMYPDVAKVLTVEQASTMSFWY